MGWFSRDPKKPIWEKLDIIFEESKLVDQDAEKIFEWNIVSTKVMAQTNAIRNAVNELKQIVLGNRPPIRIVKR
jgi:hypothetical protein